MGPWSQAGPWFLSDFLWDSQTSSAASAWASPAAAVLLAMPRGQSSSSRCSSLKSSGVPSASSVSSSASSRQTEPPFPSTTSERRSLPADRFRYSGRDFSACSAVHSVHSLLHMTAHLASRAQQEKKK